MPDKKQKKSKIKRKIAIIVSIGIAIAFFSIIINSEFYSDPVRIMYYYHFQNGTQKWLESDVIVYHDFKNGTIAGMFVGDMIQKLKLDNTVQKVIHLKDGTTDYYYKHNDFIGSRTS